MKRLALILACLGLATAAEAQTSTYFWVEPQVALEKSTDSQLVTGEHFTNVSFGHQQSPKLGGWAQFALGNFWGEAAAGYSVMVSDELQIGAGIGKELKGEKPWRVRLNAYYDHAKSGSFVYVQWDGDRNSSWIWADATRMHGHFGLGLLVQMPDGGVGPKAEFRFGQHLGLWVAPVYDWPNETVRTLVGGRIMFEK